MSQCLGTVVLLPRIDWGSMHVEHVHSRADRQFGLLTRDDLRRSGASDKQIEHLVRTKAILRVHRKVYRLPGAPRSVEQDALGACMALGDYAVTSHITGGRLWKFFDREGLPEVSVPRGRRCEQSTLVVHRPTTLTRDEVTRIGIIPVTRVARTLSDLQPRLPSDDLEEALDEALRRRMVTPAQLAKYPRLRKLAQDRMEHGVPGSKLIAFFVD